MSQSDVWRSFSSIESYCQDSKLMQTCTKYGHRRDVLCLEWSVDGKYLASGSADCTAMIYKCDTDKALKDSSAQFCLDGHKASITSLHWNPKKPSILCTASEDEHVYLWDIDKYSSSSSSGSDALSSSASSAMDVDHEQNGTSTAAASSVVKSCKPYHIIKTGNALNGIAWSHDGTKMMISDRGNTITLVDGHKYTELKKHKAPSHNKIHSFIWSNDDKYILITTKDGMIQIFDSLHLQKVHELQLHSGHCVCIDIARNNKYIATGGTDGMVTVVDMATLIQMYGMSPFETSVNAVSFNFNSKLIASASDDRVVEISYIDEQQKVKIKCPHCTQLNTKTSIMSLKWHPSKHLLAYCGYNKSHTNSSNLSGAEANEHCVSIW
eukprot:CAMPEP_0202703428 /NCGR_PEP_ID=MMETSP1385-20130828/16277_1 /ASSEMBLY_ACC=CAM_ASM_000861 /TAXON_ID=933848 /ORGANISM="Elphidium margaritaceum" /LENGTH=380 /DNA_ID=CAMNT_0049361281 /DNA_START=24 /DNA_END=1163 /DNA_ORIENTATION=-